MAACRFTTRPRTLLPTCCPFLPYSSSPRKITYRPRGRPSFARQDLETQSCRRRGEREENIEKERHILYSHRIPDRPSVFISICTCIYMTAGTLFTLVAFFFFFFFFLCLCLSPALPLPALSSPSPRRLPAERVGTTNMERRRKIEKFEKKKRTHSPALQFSLQNKKTWKTNGREKKSPPFWLSFSFRRS